LRNTCIGILGGGQLARMSAYQAYKLGFEVAILEKIKNSPAGQLTHNEFVGWVDNEAILKKFALRSDIVTLENEFVDYKYLELIEDTGKKVFPSSLSISLIQDKLIQKQTLSKNKIPVPKFLEINKAYSYQNIAEKIGEKFILKSRKMGYDGYGNFLVKKHKDFDEGINSLTKRHAALLGEEFVNFKMELAVMVVRTMNEIKVYPLVETIQKDHICHIVIAPAQVSNEIKKEAQEIAIESVKAMNGFGLFGVEMFLTDSNKILVNEMAPRPHNSGHYTIEACTTSQFENHIRSVLNLPIGSTEMIKPFAVMINLLGKREGVGIVEDYKKTLRNQNVHLHVYGKDKSRLGRKMGHITILGDNLKSTLAAAKKVEKETII
jgi:5-(carboxyamino)imidazole ribonucleotide synthase